MKLRSQIPFSTSRMPTAWPASDFERLIFFLCRQMRPQLVTRRVLS
jgi:hypothetical protein